ncbi:hypothetical protein ACFTUC_38985 [Streptomyces sp. NPDC056944]|uniref:hypothetical protein n=1 Tax=unclassified Streptomyces TaxID=2593676 RepID=UPI003631D994
MKQVVHEGLVAVQVVDPAGNHLVNIKASGPVQGLRPLRDPGAVEDDEDND